MAIVCAPQRFTRYCLTACLSNKLCLGDLFVPKGVSSVEMQRHQLPSMVLRLVCDSIIDNLGEKSLRLLMTQSGLQAYYQEGALPPADNSPSLTLPEFSNLFTTMFRIFGDRGIKPILLRAGRRNMQHFRETNKTLTALAGAAFKVLPTDAKIKLVLSRAAKAAEELLYTEHIFRETAEGYMVEIVDSPYCVGIEADHGVCYVAQGFYGEAVAWATNQQHKVEELTCRAHGDDRCRILISREPIS
jgi:predicted hydrocarbon binding protein